MHADSSMRAGKACGAIRWSIIRLSKTHTNDERNVPGPGSVGVAGGLFLLAPEFHGSEVVRAVGSFVHRDDGV